MVLDPPVSRDDGLVFWSGGPVEPERGFLLLGESPEAVDNQRVSEGMCVTASVEALWRLPESDPEAVAPQRVWLPLGYAGWGRGQLGREFTASAWLTAPAEPSLVFDTAPELMRERAVRSLGVDPLELLVSGLWSVKGYLGSEIWAFRQPASRATHLIGLRSWIF